VGQIEDLTDQREVVSAKAVTWSDGSLGCPEPGKLYTQAFKVSATAS
jgi:hypothetical protein